MPKIGICHRMLWTRHVLVLEEPSEDRPSATDVQRGAAWAAFKAVTQQGWRADGDTHDREELHEQ